MKPLFHSRPSTALLWLTATFWALTIRASDRVVISSEEEIEAGLLAVNCDNREHQKEVVKLFGKMGATTEDLVLETCKEVENVVLRKPGATEEVIVLGAHYDKAFAGCGANQLEWSRCIGSRLQNSAPTHLKKDHDLRRLWRRGGRLGGLKGDGKSHR